MKKIWSLFLTVCIVSALFGSIPVIVSAEINSTDNNLMIPKENFSVLNDSLEESVNSTTAIVSDNSQNVDVFAGGNGTAENPYQVATPEQLNEVRNYLSAYFIQICDIDMTDATSENGIFWNDGAGWLPIGTEQTPFTGRFNGQNYKIKGLNIYKLNNGCAGLFGYLGENSLIQNVQLVNGQYQLDISDVAYGVYIGDQL